MTDKMASRLTLVTGLKEGSLSPQEALDKFEVPSTHIADIGFDFDSSTLNTGFPSINDLGLIRANKDDLIILAARPGVGKTGLACQIALNISRYGNVLGFSLEMAKKQLNSRLLSLETGISIRALGLSSNRPALDAALKRFKAYKLRIDDTNSLDVESIISRTLDFHRREPVDFVFIDYLQIVPTHISRSRAEEVSHVAEKLKELAKNIQRPVLAIAQMNRAFDTRLTSDPTSRPIMSDLADSAGIERWADMIVCLHKVRDNAVHAFVIKNRHGESKDFQLGFIGNQTKFVDEGVLI